MNYYHITSSTDLQRLLPLFSESYGEPVALQDELDYFTTQQPRHWYYAAPIPEVPKAFLRYFPVGLTALQELDYWGPKDMALPLLDHLLAQIESDAVFKTAFRWKNQLHALLPPETLSTRGFEAVATYARFEYTTPVLLAPTPQVRWAKNSDLPTIQTILTQAFGPLALDTLRQYALHQRLTVVLNETGTCVGACLTNLQTKARELVQIAVDPMHRGQGHGRLLLTQSLVLHQQQQPSLHLWLRVRTDNRAALALYRGVGFRQTETETWWVRD